MKKIVFFFLVLSSISSCNNNDDNNGDSFCEDERTLYENVEDKTAQLVYLDSKNKYALKFYPSFPTIDDVTYCIICSKPTEISVNDAVKFSGELYNFNSDEDFTPSVGGENYYFTKIEQIQKLDF